MLDGGPSRLTQSTGRRAPYRQESTRSEPDESRPVESDQPERQPVKKQPKAPKERNGQAKNWLKPLLSLLVLAALVYGGWLYWSNQRAADLIINEDSHQAVFLSNGQIYFGKLTPLNGRYMQLTEVYYLERQLTANTDDQLDQAEADVSDNNFQLLKYSDALYGSEDLMVISRDDILRYENLKADGVVGRAIINRQQ